MAVLGRCATGMTLHVTTANAVYAKIMSEITVELCKKIKHTIDKIAYMNIIL